MPSPSNQKNAVILSILTRILRVTAKMNAKIGTDSIGLTPCSLGAKRSAAEGPAAAFAVVLALAFLSVIPAGNLLLLALSYPCSSGPEVSPQP